MDKIPYPKIDFSPWSLSGVVYGALLNCAQQLAEMGDAVNAAPYKAPPKFPVLQVRPRNTLCKSGSNIAIPGEPGLVNVGVSLGVIIGKTACQVSEDQVQGVMAGYVLVAELGLTCESHYRPAVRFLARDNFTVIGPAIAAEHLGTPDTQSVVIRIDGSEVLNSPAGNRVRCIAALVEAVTEFMTLQPGDVLLLGACGSSARARTGQTVSVEMQGLGALNFSLTQEGATTETENMAHAPTTARKYHAPTARVAFAGAVHIATPHPQGLQLADGRVLHEKDVQWLPPFEVGTILALGLNYADHLKEFSKELTISSKDEPLVFMKGPGSLVGHRGVTRRPAGVQFMHYECELAVIIGKTAKNVGRDHAMDHVAGYTVCNDYAIRDFLENWYRPNLRVKNRDGATALGPWFIPASMVANPHALVLTTHVNGKLTQDGTTANMVNDIPALIEYLSSFMTLQAGDVILTGTPEGVVNVNEGDEVVCEIEGIGRLVNTIVGDTLFGR